MTLPTFAPFLDVVCPVVEDHAPADAYKLAYERLRTEIAAVKDDELTTINVDVPSAVITVKAALPSVQPLRSGLACLPGFEPERFDKLHDYADALFHLHAVYGREEKPAPELPALYDEAFAARDTILAVTRGLVKMRLLEGALFASAGATTGYRNVAIELAQLCGALLDQQAALAGRTPFSDAQLLRGTKLANQIVDALARRDQAPARVSAAAKERQRAYTLLVRAYDQVRRGVSYLRWDEGDADVVAPSLYAGRGGTGRKGGKDAKEADAGAAASTGADAPATEPGAPRGGGLLADARAFRSATSEPKGDPLFTDPPSEPFLRG